MKRLLISSTKKLYGLDANQKSTIKNDLTLDNPKYHQALKYSRYSNVKIPKYLKFYRETKEYLEVPRGYTPEINFDTVEYDVIDAEVNYPDFQLELRTTQREAFESYMQDTTKGIIILPTGKGKSILGCYIASQLKQRTLIIVHKDDLVSGWKADAKLCFGDDFETGLIKAKARKVGDQITISTIQTLNRLSEEELNKYLNTFGLIIVDEMHHSPSSSFDLVQNFKGKYRVGLTATPERTDGLTPLFNFHFGGVAYEFELTEHDEDILPVVVNITKIPEVEYEPLVKVNNKLIPISKAPKNRTYNISYHTTEDALIKNPKYYKRVLNDIVREYNKDRSIIVFLNQKEHCRFIYDLLAERGLPEEEMQLYYGDAKESKDEMKRKAETKEVLITIATYSIATEGTNVKQWEVAVLVASINNEKNVEQAVGRIRRTKEGKISPVVVYDYSLPNVYTISRHIYTRMRRYNKLMFKIVGAGIQRTVNFGGRKK